MAATFDALITELGGVLGDRLITSASACTSYTAQEGYTSKATPAAVARVQSTEEVSRTLGLCSETGTPVIAYGAGTSLEGQLAPVRQSIVMDFGEMTRVREINTASRDCFVDAGITRNQLNRELRETGLYFPIDPGADASIGGMAATRASGTNAVRYGTMRENILGLEVVTPDGTIINTGSRARKSAAGLDLTSLYIGSEGTLGLITGVRLRLYGRPEYITTIVCQFASLEGAVTAVTGALAVDLPLARIELLDALQMKACIAYSGLRDMQEKPTLFIDLYGSSSPPDDELDMLKEIVRGNGAAGLRLARDREERQGLWKARHDAYYASLALKPGCKGLATDACVPIDRLPECAAQARSLADASGLTAPITGHVGDGNFHALILYDPGDKAETERAHALCNEISRLALQMGGTSTGEHGIGLHKMELMEEEHGAALAVMRTLKQTLDPHGILNPGKMIPGSGHK